MSRSQKMANDRESRFPRVSGDEPQAEIIEGLEMAFSPRERG